MKKAISLLLVVAMTASMAAVPLREARASMNTFVDKSLADMAGSAAGFNPTWSSDQQANYLSLGGFRSRTALGGSIRPVTLTMPTLTSGCGGIDLNWGGMAVLQVKYIIQAFKHILQAAPSMAFNLAFSTLCQSCEAIMSKLRAFADKINAMTMDKCKTAGMLGGMMLDGLNNLGLSSATGAVKSYFSEITGMNGDTLGNWANQAESWLNNSAVGKYLNCDPIDVAKNGAANYDPSNPSECSGKAQKMALKKPGSVLKMAFEDAHFDGALGNVTEFENLLRAVVGDIVIEDDRQKDASFVGPPEPSTGPKIKIRREPTYGGSNLKDIWEALYMGTNTTSTQLASLPSFGAAYNPPTLGNIPMSPAVPKIKGIACEDKGGGYEGCVTREVDIDISPGMLQRTTQAYLNIYAALLSKSTVSSTDLALLNLCPFPAYKVINAMTVMRSSAAVSNIQKLAEAAATATVNGMFEDVFNRLFSVLGAFMKEVDRAAKEDPTVEEVRDWMNSVQQTYKDSLQYIAMQRDMSLTNWSEQVKNAQTVEQLERSLMKGAIKSSLGASALASQSLANFR